MKWSVKYLLMFQNNADCGIFSNVSRICGVGKYLVMFPELCGVGNMFDSSSTNSFEMETYMRQAEHGDLLSVSSVYFALV